MLGSLGVIFKKQFDFKGCKMSGWQKQILSFFKPAFQYLGLKYSAVPFRFSELIIFYMLMRQVFKQKFPCRILWLVSPMYVCVLLLSDGKQVNGIFLCWF